MFTEFSGEPQCFLTDKQIVETDRLRLRVRSVASAPRAQSAAQGTAVHELGAGDLRGLVPVHTMIAVQRHSAHALIERPRVPDWLTTVHPRSHGPEHWPWSSDEACGGNQVQGAAATAAFMAITATWRE